MALVVLPEDQSKTPGNLRITLIPAADVDEVEDEVEVALEAVAVAAAVEVLVVVRVVQVALAREVKPGEVANGWGSRDD